MSIKRNHTSAKSIFRLLNWSKFESTRHKTVHIKYYLSNVEIEDLIKDVIIDEQKFFDQPVKNNSISYIRLKKLWFVKEMITLLVVY